MPRKIAVRVVECDGNENYLRRNDAVGSLLVTSVAERATIFPTIADANRAIEEFLATRTRSRYYTDVQDLDDPEAGALQEDDE